MISFGLLGALDDYKKIKNNNSSGVSFRFKLFTQIFLSVIGIIFLTYYLDNQELTYGQTDFQQGGVIVATSNKNTHGSICLEIKKIIEDNGIYPL